MTGWIIYEKENVSKNINYINWYIEKFAAENIKLTLVFTDEINYSSLPDFAVVRAMRPDITKKLEKEGVRCFNRSNVSEIGNDKLLTYRYVSRNGTEIMPVYESIDDIPEYPVVIKPTRSHGGDRVNMAENRAELENLLPLYTDDYVIQAAASDRGRDLRVYVIGREIIASMLRISENDFRSNFSLGGTARPYKLSSEEIKKVKRITDLFSPDFAGIDFVFHNGRAVFNEIEDVAGSRMLYTYTDIDIVDIYVKYIIKCMKNINKKL